MIDVVDVVIAREAADVATLPAIENPGEEHGHVAVTSRLAPESNDELAAVDAGWD